MVHFEPFCRKIVPVYVYTIGFFFIEVYMRTSVKVNGTHPPPLVGLVPFLCLPGDPTS